METRWKIDNNRRRLALTHDIPASSSLPAADIDGTVWYGAAAQLSGHLGTLLMPGQFGIWQQNCLRQELLFTVIKAASCYLTVLDVCS